MVASENQNTSADAASGDSQSQSGGPTTSGAGQNSQGTGVLACDACRTRKVKCTPTDDSDGPSQNPGPDGQRPARCKLCSKKGEDCTFEYVYKKPGRPIGATKRRRTSQSPSQPHSPSDRPSASPSRSRRLSHASFTQGTNASAAAPAPSYNAPPTNRSYQSNPSQSPHYNMSSNPFPHHSASAPAPAPFRGSGGIEALIPTGSAPASGDGGNQIAGSAAGEDTMGNSGLHASMFNTGPASGTIFGSALSALHSDHTFTDLFGPATSTSTAGGVGAGSGSGGGGGGGGVGGGGPAISSNFATFGNPVASINFAGGLPGTPNGSNSSTYQRPFHYPGADGGPIPGISLDLGPSPNWTNWQDMSSGFTPPPVQSQPPEHGNGMGGPSNMGNGPDDSNAQNRPMTSGQDRSWDMMGAYPNPSGNGNGLGNGGRQQTMNQQQGTGTSDRPDPIHRASDASATTATAAAGTANAKPRIPHPATRPDIPQIETVAPWQDICFFLSLHMRHQHGLMPLVHKPTFAQDVLQRRDLTDEVFRGLLCSIVAYTICQLPVQVMSPKYPRRDLEMLLRRCQKTSRAIQLRWHMSPCLESLASLQLDTNTALACTQLDLASALISDIRRQVYSLGLHKYKPREGLSFLEIQLCRRLFWEIYQSDKTNVMNSISVISLNDMEGTPPLPLEIDDDYLTNSTSTPQPQGSISYMTGFVVVSRIFQILGQAQIRQRTWSNNPSAGSDRAELLSWIAQNQVKMREIIQGLPAELRAEGHEHKVSGGFERADESSLGIQRANIHITALCVEFALLDFKVHLRPGEDTKVEREALARKAYTTLSSVPMEYLASNGESMRGKVLRIVLDLLNHTSEPGMFGETVWDWWNMYSSVQFFQIIPDIDAGDSTSASRRASPQPGRQGGQAIS